MVGDINWRIVVNTGKTKKVRKEEMKNGIKSGCYLMLIAWFDHFILYTCVEMLHSTLKNILCANKKSCGTVGYQHHIMECQFESFQSSSLLMHLGKRWKMALAGPCHPRGGLGWSSWLLALALACFSHSHWGHLENETVDGRYSLFVWLPFKIIKKTTKLYYLKLTKQIVNNY